MKKLITVLSVFLLIAASVLGYFSFERNKEATANDEIISPEELFDVSGNQVAIMLNNMLEDARGIYDHDQIYLPLSWVNAYVNDKFYWDEQENRMIYTLPEEIMYSDFSSKGKNGNPLLLKSDGQIYLTLGLVNTYSDITCKAYAGDARRVFIETSYEPYRTAVVKKDTMLRTGESRLQRGIISLAEGTAVRILFDREEDDPDAQFDRDDPWVRIRTDDGFTGYMQKVFLTDFGSETPTRTYQAPQYSSIHYDEKIILGWHQVTNETAAAVPLSEILKNNSTINVISPTWYSLSDTEGNFTSLVNDSFIADAHARGIAVWALIDNFMEGLDTTALLANTAAREKLIGALIESLVSHGIDGINVDFENLTPECGPHFVQFLRELSVSCRANRLVLSVDNPNAASFNQYYGRRQQGECCDYVINMGYDEHFAGGEAGSVASLPFVEEGIRLTLTEVPAEKVLNGVPFYTRVWDIKDGETVSQALGLSEAAQWAKDHKISLRWDDSLGQYRGESGTAQVWLENKESLEGKMSLAREANLAGIGCWKLGLESTDVWDVLHF